MSYRPGYQVVFCLSCLGPTVHIWQLQIKPSVINCFIVLNYCDLWTDCTQLFCFGHACKINFMLTSGPLPGQNFLVKKENNIEFFLQEKSMSMLGSNPDQNIVIYEVKHVCSVWAQCHACTTIICVLWDYCLVWFHTDMHSQSTVKFVSSQVLFQFNILVSI